MPAGPWDKATGRRRRPALWQAVGVTLPCLRHNAAQEVIADSPNVSQPLVSQITQKPAPLVAGATEAWCPGFAEAVEIVRGKLALVDGTLWPCWSWAGHRELWAGKHQATGHGSLVVSDDAGNIVFVSEAVPGCQHDMRKPQDSDVERLLGHAGAVIADKEAYSERVKL